MRDLRETVAHDEMIFFVERLTVRSWFQSILPSLLSVRRHRKAPRGRCYIFEGSALGLVIARACRWLTGVAVEPVHVRLVDVRDEEGLLIWMRTKSADLLALRVQMMADPLIREALSSHPDGHRLALWMAKTIESQTFWRALVIIQVCAWVMRRDGLQHLQALCLLEPRPWCSLLTRYAAHHHLDVVPLSPPFRWRTWVRDHLPLPVVEALRDLRLTWLARAHPNAPPEKTSGALACRLAVDYYGHFNLQHPERYSELFFWQQSALPADRMLMLFHVPFDPLDEPKWSALNEAGFRALVLEPRATTLRGVPVCFRHHRHRGLPAWRPRWAPADRGLEARWVQRQLGEYAADRSYWTRLFASQQVKLYVSWQKFTPAHCAMADALQELGGISAFYQRSYELDPSFDGAAAIDVFFGASAINADIERRSGSRIPYCVTTGYLGDHRFGLLRNDAQAIRDRLRAHGATRIVSYSDENSHDDERWSLGHLITRESYAFLLERVLNASWLGLILKPKVPTTLRKRLGPLAELLTRAEATGRCVIAEGETVRGSYPPALAAMASDVMIHGHLMAATAGIESALAGAPTLCLDREGWTVSPLYRLGVGRVVFTDWDRLWKALLEHWNRPGGVPGFGDWSPMLNDLDPFRDGRAAERMGTYLQWLLEGFDAGRDRETILADAAERYTSRWGRETVSSVHVDSIRHEGQASVTHAVAA